MATHPFLLLIVLLVTHRGEAFHPFKTSRHAQSKHRARRGGLRLGLTPSDNIGSCADQSRRSFVVASTITGICSVSMFWPAEQALAYAQEKEDIEKIRKGYDRLEYLLSNWVKETTVCGKGDDNPYTTGKGCERTPLVVMDYLGYRNINDPLFKADKTLKRLAVRVSDDDAVEYLEAVEKWGEAAEEASGMAYVSSWGEANPGGGKDRVELFIERARKNVVDARDSLRTAKRLLNI